MFFRWTTILFFHVKDFPSYLTSPEDVHVHIDMGSSHPLASDQGHDYQNSEEIGTSEKPKRMKVQNRRLGSLRKISCTDCSDLGVVKYNRIWGDDQCENLGMLRNIALG